MFLFSWNFIHFTIVYQTKFQFLSKTDYNWGKVSDKDVLCWLIVSCDVGGACSEDRMQHANVYPPRTGRRWGAGVGPECDRAEATTTGAAGGCRGGESSSGVGRGRESEEGRGEGNRLGHGWVQVQLQDGMTSTIVSCIPGLYF